MMTGPAPTADELATILTVASRVPDHGKLAPWRFVVFEGRARERAGRLALEIRLADKPDLDEAARAEGARRFARAPLVVAVVSRAAPHVKDPGMGAGAVRRRGLHEHDRRRPRARLLRDLAHRMVAYDDRFRAAIGLAEHERIAGFMHIGRATRRSRIARARRWPRS